MSTRSDGSRGARKAPRRVEKTIREWEKNYADTWILLEVTEEALRCGIKACLPGNRISDISRSVQSRVEREGFSVVRDFVGHGIGTAMHEDPPVPNYVMPGRDVRLVEGMVLAIEPMVNVGKAEVVIGSDSWTASTADGSASAHFERSVAIIADGPRVLGENGAVAAASE